MFKQGDYVQMSFSKNSEVGIVIGYHDAEVVIVKVNNEIKTIFESHLTKVVHNQNITDDSKPKKVIKSLDTSIPDMGAKVAMQPVYNSESLIDYFMIYLINDTGRRFQVDYKMNLLKSEHFRLKQSIGGRETLLLNTLQYDEMNDNPALIFHFELAEEEGNFLVGFKKIAKPKAKMLRKPPDYIDNSTIHQPVYTYDLFQNIPKNEIKNANYTKLSLSQSQRIKSAGKAVQKVQIQQNELPEKQGKIVVHTQERVIDLHIEKLMTNYDHLPKNKILTIQLNHFEDELKTAIYRKEENMIAIHGLGKGKLKQEIVKIAMSYPEVRNFQNSYDARFGFGATEITFEY